MPPLRAGWHVAISTILCLSLTVGGCSRTSPAESSRQLEAPRAKAIAAALDPPPQCPPTKAPILQPSATTNHHRAILWWIASAPSTNRDAQAVGYCLYRSTTQGAGSKRPDCDQCEQVNSTPILQTGCIDTLVQDGAHYYYVVAAVNWKSKLSQASNEIPVIIPSTPQSTHATAASSYPMCRPSSASK